MNESRVCGVRCLIASFELCFHPVLSTSSLMENVS